MKRMLLAVAATLAVSAAQAEPYITAGGHVGSKPLGADLAVGYRLGALSLEAGYLGRDFMGEETSQTITTLSPLADDITRDIRNWRGYRVSAKLQGALSGNLDLYAKATGYAIKTFHSVQSSTLADHDNNPNTARIVTATSYQASEVSTVSPAAAFGAEYRLSDRVAVLVEVERVKWKAGVLGNEAKSETFGGVGLKVSF